MDVGSELSLSTLFKWRGRSIRRWQVFVSMFSLYLLMMMLSGLGLVGNTARRTTRGQARLKQKTEGDSVLITEFGRRKKIIKDTCERMGAYTTKDKLLARMKLKPGPNLTQGVEKDDELWPLLKKTSHHQFFVQREYGLMWCKVPKAASTSWLHAFLKLSHVPSYDIPEDNGMGLHAFLRDKYPLLSKNLNKHFMPLSLKFLVARHPFQRLVSAYQDKLQDYARDLKYRGGYYYAMYGADIVTKFREKFQTKFPKHPLFLRKEPSFVEFVWYLIETPLSHYDEHWKPIFLLCPPCHFKFDVIVKMETFNRDTDFILEQRNLKDLVSLKKSHSSSSGSSDNSTKALFSQLSKPLVQALYEKYRLDFLMFEYEVGEYLDYASESQELMPQVMPGGPSLGERVEEEKEVEEVVDESEDAHEEAVKEEEKE